MAKATAAAKPAASPQAPPPSVTTPQERSKPLSSIRRHRDNHASGVLAPSPWGSGNSLDSSPAARRLLCTHSP